MFTRWKVATACVMAGLLLALSSSQVRADDKDDPIVAFVKQRVKDANKPFTLVVIVKVKEGKGKDFEEAFARALKGTRKEKGCITYDLNRDSDNANRYVVYERWKTVADLEAHLKTDHIKALRMVLPDVLDGGPELRVKFPAAE